MLHYKWIADVPDLWMLPVKAAKKAKKNTRFDISYQRHNLLLT